MPFLLLSFVVFTLAFVWIYARGVEAKGWLGQGLRYGLAIWLIATVSRYLTYYAIQPWSATVVAAQVGLELIATLLVSVVLAAMYRKPASRRRGGGIYPDLIGTPPFGEINSRLRLGDRFAQGGKLQAQRFQFKRRLDLCDPEVATVN